MQARHGGRLHFVDLHVRTLLSANPMTELTDQYSTGSQSGTGATASTRFSAVQYHSVRPGVLQYHYTGHKRRALRDPVQELCFGRSVNKVKNKGKNKGKDGGTFPEVYFACTTNAVQLDKHIVPPVAPDRSSRIRRRSQPAMRPPPRAGVPEARKPNRIGLVSILTQTHHRLVRRRSSRGVAAACTHSRHMSPEDTWR